MLRFKKADGTNYPEWRTLSLNCVADVYDGTHQTPKYVDEGVKFVSVENIGNLYGSEKYISQEAYSRDYKVKAEKGDVLMTRIGDIGSAAIVDGNEELAYYVSLALLKCTGISPNYLLHLIHSPFFKRELWKRTLHTAFPKKINKGDISLCEILLPCKEEQQKIADCLSSVDAVIADYEAQVENMQNQKKGVMQKLFSQGVRFKADDGSEYPEWEKVQLKDVCDDFIVPMRDKPKVFDGTIPWCRIEDVEGNYIHNSSLKQYVSEKTVKDMNLKIHPTGTVICSCSASLGTYMINTRPLVTNQTFIGLVCGDRINNHYLLYYMNTQTKKLRVIASGTTIPYISREKFENYFIEVPCLEEQQKIADCLTAFDDAIEDLQKTVEHWKNIKKGLLQQLFA